MASGKLDEIERVRVIVKRIIIKSGLVILILSFKAALLNSDEDDEGILDLNRKKPDSKIGKLNSQVNEVIDGMKANIEKVVERGQNLSDLNDRSESLGVSADQFSKRSRTLRKSMWLRTCRARMYLGITIGVIIFLFLCNFRNFIPTYNRLI